MRGNRRVPLAVGGAILAAIAALALYLAVSMPAESGAAQGTATQAPARPIDGGSFEASGVVQTPSGNGVLFVDDSRPQEIFWIELGADGLQMTPAQPVPLGVTVVDPEGLTTDGESFYVVGSQSKAEGLQGAGLVRFRFDPARRAVDRVETIHGLKALLVQQVPEFRPEGRRSGGDFNIEGLAWDPAHARLLLGMRAPLLGADAAVVPLKLKDERGPFTADNLRVDGAVLRAPFGGAGIRGLEHDAARDAFMVIAEPASGSGSSRLLEWANGAAREVARFPAALKPEGVTRITVKGGEATLVIFDTSRLMVIR